MTETQGLIEQHFATPIGKFVFPDASQHNPLLQAVIQKTAADYPSVGRSNVGGWHSRDDFLRWPTPSIKTLLDWIIPQVDQMSRHTAALAGLPPFRGERRATGWANICQFGHYHAPHAHPESHWSAVYYVEAGSQASPPAALGPSDRPLSGVLEFLDPRAAAHGTSGPSDFFGSPVRVVPQSGLLVVFPSWLMHFVHPYFGDVDRISISLNISLHPAV